jgi:glycosyltransferase involved in cell wall biosynthesis
MKSPAPTTSARASRPINVLYVNHIGAFGGASRSLMEMIRAFPPRAVRPFLLSPKGRTTGLFRQIDVPVMEVAGICQFDNTRYGYYRGPRWLLLFRELLFSIGTLLSMWRACKRWPIDVVHVNEITALLSIVFAKVALRKPIIVHVRSMQETSRVPRRARAISWLVRKFAAQVIAIDLTVQRSLPIGIQSVVIHNGFSCPQNDLAADSSIDSSIAAPATPIRVAMVGNLQVMKGVFDFVEAARICNAGGLAAEFLIVGEETRDLRGLKAWIAENLGLSRRVKADLQRKIDEYGLEGYVKLVGFCADLETIYRRIDLLCFPSHLNAVGRPVFEAAFFSVPSLVAVEDPLPDTMINGVTGLCIKPADPVGLASSISLLARDPSLRYRLGKGARDLAARYFDPVVNALEVLSIYHRLTEQSTR